MRDWGNDFVPSDIAANIVVAREFLDQQPAPGRRMLQENQLLDTSDIMTDYVPNSMMLSTILMRHVKYVARF